MKAGVYGADAGFAIFHAVIRLFGPTPAYVLLAFVLPYYLLIRGDARKSAYHYLARRFPEKGRPGLFLAACRHLFEFGKVMIDQAAMGILGRDAFRCEFPGRERLCERANRGRGTVLLTTHAGNWRAAMATMDNLDARVNLLFNATADEGRHFFDLAGNRDKFHIIPPDGFMGGMVEAANALSAKEVVAVMGDRAFGGKTIELEFLGGRAFFPITPYHLAAATGADLVVMLTVRTQSLSFAIETECISEGVDWSTLPRDEAIKTLAERYVSRLEAYVGKYPYMWFNFFDMWDKGGAGIVTGK